METKIGAYLHYIHIEKQWYYWFSDFSGKRTFRPYEGDGSLDERLIHFADENTTKAQAKKKLEEMFPDHTPILSYPYHMSPRIGKNGSRPHKERYKECWKERCVREEKVSDN